jgi:Na+/phosphate symporter
MIASALFITVAVLLALGFWLMGELRFFLPYRTVLFHEYGQVILIYAALLFVNLFAATSVLIRKFFLKDTGRKLSHLDKQLHIGETEVPAPWSEQELN